MAPYPFFLGGLEEEIFGIPFVNYCNIYYVIVDSDELMAWIAFESIYGTKCPFAASFSNRERN